MPLTRLRRFLAQGRLRFDKFGEIDYDLHSLPEDKTIYVDIDSKSSELLCYSDINSLLRIIGLHPLAYCYARTRRGWHIAITFKESFTDLERIALQSICGDDDARSALNFMRYWHSRGAAVPEFWRRRSNILYRRKLA